MTTCCSCRRELKVVVPKGTEVWCGLCEVRKDNPDKPRKTLLVPIKEMIANYEEYLEDELEYFKKEVSAPYSFEQSYSLMGSQDRIDGLRIKLYWLKQVIGETQEDVIESVE